MRTTLKNYGYKALVEVSVVKPDLSILEKLVHSHSASRMRIQVGLGYFAAGIGLALGNPESDYC